MADLSDVTDALGEMTAAALYPPAQYPDGPGGFSVANIPVLVQGGWPVPATLDKIAADAAGAEGKPKVLRAQVTIYPRTTERNVTRYPRKWGQTGPLQAQTFTLTKAGQVIAIGGGQPAEFYGQNFAVFVNGVAYVYRSVEADTAATIATALAAMIPGATAAGADITVPNLARIGALRVGTQAPVAMEVKRQQREFQLTVWAPRPELRDTVAAPIDVAIGLTQWLTFCDGSKGRLLYKGSPFTDFDQKYGLYRRDIIVTVEYPTLASDTAAQAIAFKTEVSQEAPDGSAIDPPILTTYT